MKEKFIINTNKFVNIVYFVPDFTQYISHLSFLMRRAVSPSTLVTEAGVTAGSDEH